jgi:hypothetical protein
MSSRLGWNGRHVWNYYGLASGTAWCAGEISYTFAKMGQKGMWYGGKPVFYVPYAQEWMAKNYKTIYDYRGKGSLSNAKKGDIVIFMWSRGSRDHIGAVRKTTGSSSTLMTIEGNTNGGVVANRTRAKVNIYAVYRPPYKQELTKRDMIAKTAKQCSWPMGTPMSKRGYPNGAPKPEFKKALNKAYPNRSGWSAQPRAGASCDVAVGTFIRASGADKKWPRGLDEVEGYANSKRGRKRWQRISNPKRSDLKPGDVIYQIFNSGAGHISGYLGNGRVANAHYYGKSYPVIQKYENEVRSPSGCRKFYVYRRRV